MDLAARRLTLEIAKRQRRRLNAACEAVFLSHAGQPVDEVMAALGRKASTANFEPDDELLGAAARAISLGRRYTFE
jgi:hypothetical protein